MTSVPSASAGAVRNGGDELRGDGTDHALLAQIAALTGGELIPSLGETPITRPPPRRADETLVPLCLIIALFALLLSVAARRLDLGRAFAGPAAPAAFGLAFS